ncbi:MAG: sugar phosphate isomerase/epimerase [Planctomycetota bacterium]
MFFFVDAFGIRYYRGMSGKITILLSTGSIFHLPLADQFRAAKESGFDGVELMLGPELEHVPDAQFASLSETHNVSIRCVHAPFFAASGLTDDYVREIDRAIETARRVNAVLVNLHPFGLIRRPEEVRHLAERAGDIILSTENMPRGIDIFDPDEAPVIHDHEALNDFAGANGLKMTYDVSHFATWGRDIFSGYRLFQANVANIHVSDYIAGYQHLLPGRGELPLRGLLRLVGAEGVAAFVTLEASPDSFGRKGYEFVVEALTTAREFIEKELRRGT